jgi:DNA-binding CsgD family transcriptional regulator
MPLRFSQFLLELYGLAPRTPSPAFCDAVLKLLERIVPFDSGLWGAFTVTPGGPRPHWGHLHRLPPEMLADYERVKQHDLVNQELIAHPGRTVAVALRQAERTAHPDVVAHARRWGMEHILATVLLESPLNLYTAIRLYRADPARHYTASERRIKQAVMPHLVAAWHMNALQLLDMPARARDGAARARALVDRFGVIHNAEPGLADLLRRELHKWQGPSLPPSLLSMVRGDESEHEGKAIVFTRLRVLEDGTFVIGLRSRSRVDSLSARELEVAREFASGKTHKQVAASLSTSPATVRSQLQTVYAKLGVSTKVDLARRLEEDT